MVLKYHDTDVGFLCPLPLPVFLEEDKGPDHDALAASGIARGLTGDDVVREAWQHRHDPVPHAITTQTWTAPPRPVPDVSYPTATG